MVLKMIYEVVLATLASMGFAVIFNIRKEHLFIGSISGGVAWFFYSLFNMGGFNSTFAIFMGSALMSLYSELMARRHKTPATAFIVCGMIPLVPGGGMYYTVYEYVNHNYDRAMAQGVTTVTSAVTIAIGIVFIYSIFRMNALKKRAKMMKKQR